MSTVQEIKAAIESLSPVDRAELERLLWKSQPPLDPDVDSPELEAELLKAIDGPYTAYSSEEFREIGEGIIRERNKKVKLAIQKAEFFKQDFAKQFAWYIDEAGPEIARRFQAALDQSLNKLAKRPDLGRPRHFRNPRLHGLRSLPIERPFNRILVFYRTDGKSLHAVRLIHGARDLPRRLAESPAT